MNKTTNKYSPEVRERAVRMVLDNQGQHESRWSAILSISAKIGCSSQRRREKYLLHSLPHQFFDKLHWIFHGAKIHLICYDRHDLSGENMTDVSKTHTTSFGNAAPRCQAKSKRSGQQCGKPAMRGKAVCRTHGGASTGPKTLEGRKRCAEARTIHGREGRATRQRRAEKLKELRELEKLMIDAGLIC